MKPPGHAAVSLAIGGALWAVTKSPYALVSAVVAGVMVDLDHLVEYYWWFVKEDHTRVWYFLHSYELAVPSLLGAYLSGWDPIVMGASFAFLGHVLTDQLVNPMAPLAYFFSYRAMNGFRRNRIVNSDWEELQRDFLRVPVTRRILGIFNPRIKGGK